MIFVRTAVALTAMLSLASGALAQQSMRYSLTVGPYRVNRLAGTPNASWVGLHKPVGRRGLIGGRLGLIRNAGFYSLNALTLDLDFGVRSRPGRVEWQATAGTWGLLGGDNDGTPYFGIGAQAATGVTWWAQPHLGFLALGTARLKLDLSREPVTGGGAFGVVVR